MSNNILLVANKFKLSNLMTIYSDLILYLIYKNILNFRMKPIVNLRTLISANEVVKYDVPDSEYDDNRPDFTTLFGEERSDHIRNLWRTCFDPAI